MTATYTYDGAPLSIIRSGSVAFTQSAELGQVGGGQFTIDDTAGTTAIVGQKDFSATQSACSTPLMFRGFVGDRLYERGLEAQGAAREIRVSLEDLNSMLGHRLIYQAPGLTVAQGGKRPAETVAARGAWLMASGFVAFSDLGRCSFPSTLMDVADYRYQHAGDVLADMALASGGYNYHVNDWGSGPELTFRDDNASTADSSTLRISNDLADASGVTLNPKNTATLRRSPAKVISRLAYNYAKGTIVAERAATATAFNGERSGSASNSLIRTPTKANAEAQSQLWQLHTEEDLIDCEIDAVTAAQINLILPGMRLQAKFTHLVTEGYGSFTYFRVLERTVRPLNAEGALYSLGLKLSPQEDAAPVTCAASATASGNYYPLGGSGEFPNPSDGVVYYYRPGYSDPGGFTVPQPGYAGRFHFPNFGPGGVGTRDGAGSCVENVIYLLVVGNGTWVVQTESYGFVRQLTVTAGPPSGLTFNQTVNAGDSFTVTFDDTASPDCVRIVAIRDSALVCGGPHWGWSGGVWTAA